MNQIVQAGTPQITNLRKRQLRDEIEASLDEQERWRKINAAYHADDLKFMRFLIPPGKRVLELGCGMGDLLAALEGPFDDIVIADTIGMFEDIDGTLRLIHQLCSPSTRIVIAYYSHLWE